MSQRALRTVHQSPFQQIEDDLVMSRIGALGIRALESVIRGMLTKGAAGIRASVFDGLTTTAGVVGLSLDISAPSFMVQRLPSGIVRAAVDNDARNIVLDPAHATLPRVDILEAQIQTRTRFTDNVTPIIDPLTTLISAQSKDRDTDIFINIRKQSGTPNASPVPPSPTAATFGQLQGTVLADVLNLTTNYLLNISVGEDVEFVTVDCRGATPAATTRAERIAAINAAGFGVVATNVGGAIYITAPGTGEDSIVRIKQATPTANDGAANILGTLVVNAYYYEYRGLNDWAKIAECTVPAAAVSMIAGNVRSRQVNSTWLADAAMLKNFLSYDEHRDSVPMDHAPGSIEEYHLSGPVKALLGKANHRYVNKVLGEVNAGFRVFSFGGRKNTIAPPATDVSLQLTDATGTDLVYTKAEVASPVSRVIIDEMLANTSTSGVPAAYGVTCEEFFTLGDPDGIARATFNISSIQISINTWGISTDDLYLRIVRVSDSAVMLEANFPSGGATGVRNFLMPVTLATGVGYKWQAKQGPTNTTIIDSFSIPGNENWRLKYAPTPGIGQTSELLIGAFDRDTNGYTTPFVPYAASLVNFDAYQVYQDPDSPATVYVAVDTSLGLLKLRVAPPAGTDFIYANFYADLDLASLGIETLKGAEFGDQRDGFSYIDYNYLRRFGDKLLGSLNIGGNALLAPLAPAFPSIVGENTRVGDRSYNDLRYELLRSSGALVTDPDFYRGDEHWLRSGGATFVNDVANGGLPNTLKFSVVGAQAISLPFQVSGLTDGLVPISAYSESVNYVLRVRGSIVLTLGLTLNIDEYDGNKVLLTTRSRALASGFTSAAPSYQYFAGAIKPSNTATRFLRVSMIATAGPAGDLYITHANVAKRHLLTQAILANILPSAPTLAIESPSDPIGGAFGDAASGIVDRVMFAGATPGVAQAITLTTVITSFGLTNTSFLPGMVKGIYAHCRLTHSVAASLTALAYRTNAGAILAKELPGFDFPFGGGTRQLLLESYIPVSHYTPASGLANIRAAFTTSAGAPSYIITVQGWQL